MIIFSFIASYFSIIFLAEGKISKSISLFLSHIGPKRFSPIRLQDRKSNISLKQSYEIVFFLACWYRKLRVDRKMLGWVWSKMFLVILVIKWMDEWMDELSWFFAFWCKFRKVKNYFSNFWVNVVKNGHATLIYEWINESSWLFACWYIFSLGKLKVTLTLIGWAWSDMSVAF